MTCALQAWALLPRTRAALIYCPSQIPGVGHFDVTSGLHHLQNVEGALQQACQACQVGLTERQLCKRCCWRTSLPFSKTSANQAALRPALQPWSLMRTLNLFEPSEPLGGCVLLLKSHFVIPFRPKNLTTQVKRGSRRTLLSTMMGLISPLTA